MDQEYQIEKEDLIQVTYAKDLQESARHSKVLTFASDEIELKLFKINPEKEIVVTYTIDSPKKIKSVDEYNKNFISKSL